VALLLVLSHPPAVVAGDIVGKVRAEGKPGAEEDLTNGGYTSRRYKFLERVDYERMKDFVVYIDQPMPRGNWPTPKVQVIIQKDGTFRPHVLPILAGTTVEWPNRDSIYHNVFSMSEVKPFDLGLYRSGEIKRVTFDRPGRADVFCSIHTKMSCIILVLENPYFAATGSDGTYRIAGVPAGTFRLKAWHERLPSQAKEITVPAVGEIVQDFVLSVSGLPKY
jgi:plastocyanin